jgi:hypothetical protein
MFWSVFLVKGLCHCRRERSGKQSHFYPFLSLVTPREHSSQRRFAPEGWFPDALRLSRLPLLRLRATHR